MTIPSRFFQRTLKLAPASTHDVRVERDLRVPMPDGVVLLADRYVPGRDEQPPLVLVRSPYGRRGFWGLILGRLLAERGFQVLIQSCRGTFGSGGVLDPFGPDEHDDGLATIGWMQEQPWYPGAFGTVGPSYLGMVQWAIAADAGPDLRAMATQVTTADFRALFYAGESFSLETALTWVHQVATQEGRLAFLQQARAERRLKAIMNRLPLRDLDRLATGQTVAYYQEWLARNAPGDGYWKDRGFAATAGPGDRPGQHDRRLVRLLPAAAAARLRGAARERARAVPDHRPVAARRSGGAGDLDQRVPGLASGPPGR